MADSKTPLESNNFYHIFNHAVGNERLFNSGRNYWFFLEKLKNYLSEFIDIYCYCLMPNHFHLLIQVKNEEIILAEFNSSGLNKLNKSNVSVPKIISQQFSHLFNSYAQAFNKENDRKGSLFYNRYKRELVDSEEYMIKLIHYIHYNPVHHGFAKKLDEWEHSSYKTILSTGKTLIKRNEVIEMFNDIENFKYCHTVEPYISGIDDL
ncbi:MAG: hypothetical protein K8S16_02665 [Bacteroidales bacterium]|nr:hypothetical protein [Bacteroidales bacterium]